LLCKKIIETPELYDKIKQQEVTVIDPTYIENIDYAIQKIKLKIMDLYTNSKNDPKNEQVYDATENLAFYKYPSLFLYPYFLDENRIREKGAGVIPYAVQTSMAIIIHKKNEMYYKWGAIRDDAEADLKKSDPIRNRFSNEEIDRNVQVGVSVDWLKNLIEFIYLKNGEIHSVRGYVFNAIIQQFADTHIRDNKKMMGVLSASTDVLSVQEKLPFYRKLKAHENPSPNHILLLDPADAFKVSKNGDRVFQYLNREYDIVNVKHGLDIPVGIGFSLPALPRLLKNDNWRTLKGLILQELQSEEKLLMSVGIELEPKTISKLKAIKV